MPDQLTNPQYWDCHCPRYFIHPASDAACPVCGANREEHCCPDSLQNEIDAGENFYEKGIIMKAKHTPGPWEAVRTHAANCGYEIQKGFYPQECYPAQFIASVMAGSNGVDGRLIANARLIAAAPDLLAAAKAKGEK